MTTPFDPELALRTEVAIYADDFQATFDQLLKTTGATIELAWIGPRNRSRVYLTLRFGAGPREPFMEYRPERAASFWTHHTPRVVDFRERLEKVLALHHANFGLGISFAKRIARFNVGFPRAPRMQDSDIPLSLRLLYARRGHIGEYAPEVETETVPELGQAVA